MIRDQMPAAPTLFFILLTSGSRPFSTRSPSLERSAGRTVSDPITATATTMIVPVAKEAKVGDASQVHAGHGDHHRDSGDDHCAT